MRKYSIEKDHRHSERKNFKATGIFMKKVKALQDYYEEKGERRPTLTGIIFLAVYELVKQKKIKVPED